MRNTKIEEENKKEVKKVREEEGRENAGDR